ncbi:hypothetical protein TWF506_004481 [Arthrobotrys conoides]|uniref:Uncharacterized protein n=1 Tax=Arthrobotrys conoides TaxID=74498 RepID=A0AAN8MX00_9PEZI
MTGRTPPPPRPPSLPSNHPSPTPSFAQLPTSFTSLPPALMPDSTTASPLHSSSRQATPSISIHEASDSEDGHDTDDDTITGLLTGNGFMDYVMTPSRSPSSQSTDRLSVPPFIRSVGAPSPSPSLFPMNTGSLGGSSDGEGTIRAASSVGGGYDEDDAAVGGVKRLIRYKKAMIWKLEEDIKCLEKVCEMAMRVDRGGV